MYYQHLYKNILLFIPILLFFKVENNGMVHLSTRSISHCIFITFLTLFYFIEYQDIYINSKMQLAQLTWSICSKILDSTTENNLSFIEIRTTHRKLLQILTISQLMRSPMIPTIVKRAIGSSYHVIAGPRTRGIESRTAETGRASSLSIL